MRSKEIQSTEKRLVKALEKTPVPVGLPCLFTDKMWEFVHKMCRDHLQTNNRTQASREFVANFAFTLRQEAFNRFGHDTLETFALVDLLKEQPCAGKAPKLDSLTHIAQYRNKADRLSADQEAAAEKIKSVWHAFAKGRSSSSSLMAGGKRSQFLHPIETMDEDLLEHYRSTYVPWYERAQQVWVDKPRVRLVAVVLKIVVEDWYPELLDEAYSLNRGVALHALKNGLNGYWGGKNE